MTILDACEQVLGRAGKPLSADQIYEEIRRAGLYEFKAKDPLSIVRGTLRKHIRSAAKPRVAQVSPGLFKRA